MFEPNSDACDGRPAWKNRRDGFGIMERSGASGVDYGRLVDDTAGVHSFLLRIEETFGRDVEGWLGCFWVPFLVVPPGTDEQRAMDRDFERIEANWAMLRDEGFVRTRLDDWSIEWLDAERGMAAVASSFTRLRADGSPFGTVAPLYILRRGPVDWKAMAIVRS